MNVILDASIFVAGLTMTSAVAEFYRGADLFVTGATGFVGVALLEKVLRCCPDVGNIYCLMRPKRGKDISTRAEEFSKNLVRMHLLLDYTLFCIPSYYFYSAMAGFRENPRLVFHFFFFF